MKQMKLKSKEALLNTIWIVADDIYRSFNMTDAYTNTMEDFLRAAARPIFKYLDDIGISIHYLTNNAYEHWLRPVKFFPNLYNSFGFVYICPLYTAQQFMILDGKDPKDFYALYQYYFDEAMLVNNQFIQKCHKSNQHYILIIPDGNEDDFKLSFNMINKKGIMTIFREEAPQDSAKVHVFSENVV